MSTPSFGTGPAAGEYSVEDDNQLQPEDTLIDRGIDDMLDEGYLAARAVVRTWCLRPV